MKITSKIQAISQKEGRYAVKVEDNNWYSAFGHCPKEIAKEDSVEIEYEKSGDFNNIKSIKKIEQFMGVKVEEKKAEEKTKHNSIYMPRSMYVSYAKDIFCEMFMAGDNNAEEIMRKAIALVKQADDEFK